MSTADDTPQSTGPPRAAAEARLAQTPAKPGAVSTAEELLHELRVHQIELEMQNESLRQSQIELEASRDRYVDFYDFAPVGYLTLDDHGLIADINLTGAAMLGVDRGRLRLRRFSQAVAAEDRNRCHQHISHALKQDGTLDCELTLLRPGDTRLDVRLDSRRLVRAGEATVLRVALTDISERKLAAASLDEARTQLLQSEKMAAIGQLAAGVAHELNNPIGYVRSNLCTLDSYLHDLFVILDAVAKAGAAAPDAAPFETIRALWRAKDCDFLRGDIPQLMADSRDGLDRAFAIVRDLQDFSRAGEAESQWADLHQGLDSTLHMVQNELKYRCTTIKDYGSLPRVWCVPAQINQVFMNLLINAGHAIPEKGEITLRTGHRDDEVFVSVADTGGGIAPEHLKRIFEPFFTTKPVGKGTGLGLSLAYTIIHRHRGRFEVQSELGKGACFTIWLPVNPDTGADTGERDPRAVSPAPSFY